MVFIVPLLIMATSLVSKINTRVALLKGWVNSFLAFMGQLYLGFYRAAEEGGAEPGRVPTGAQAKEQLIHTAMDGKTLRGTLGHAKEEQPAVHLLSLYECESGIVLSQEAVKSKENEITAAIAFLHPLLVKGRIISSDAMHTQKKWCAGVDAYDG